MVIAKDSGLIGYPEKNREAARSKSADIDDKKQANRKQTSLSLQAQDGWNVKSLLLPQVNPADKVKLESVSVTGWFRAETVKHIGDTHQGDWVTELHLVERIIDKQAEKEQSKVAKKHRKKREAQKEEKTKP